MLPHEILDEQLSLMDESARTTAAFIFSLQRVALKMMRRGVLIDAHEQERMLLILSSSREWCQKVIDTYALALWNKPLNPGSYKQKSEFLYDFLQLPVQRVYDRDKKEMKPTTNRAALEKLRDNFFNVSPILRAILAYQDVKKAESILRSGIDKDGRMRSSFVVAGPITGRMASRKNVFGGGCFPPGAECLTPSGWCNIEDIQNDTLVCQAELDGTLSWAPAIPYKTKFDGKLINMFGEQIYFSVTPEHRIPVKPPHSINYRADKIKNIRHNRKLLLAGQLLESCINVPFHVRFLVAIIADASNEKNSYYRIALKKSRKINRFIALAKAADIKLTEVSAPIGYRRFSFTLPAEYPKDYGAWLLALSQKQRLEILDEIQYWDGDNRGKSTRLFTARYYRAMWLQTLAHISGYSATITEYFQSEASWSNTKMYIVNVKPRNEAWIDPSKHRQEVTYKGFVYCLSVPSTYFLARQYGMIFVSGNSNFQNWREGWRTIFTTSWGVMKDRDSFNIPEQYRNLQPVED